MLRRLLFFLCRRSHCLFLSRRSYSFFLERSCLFLNRRCLFLERRRLFFGRRCLVNWIFLQRRFMNRCLFNLFLWFCWRSLFCRWRLTLLLFYLFVDRVFMFLRNWSLRRVLMNFESCIHLLFFCFASFTNEDFFFTLFMNTAFIFFVVHMSGFVLLDVATNDRLFRVSTFRHFDHRFIKFLWRLLYFFSFVDHSRWFINLLYNLLMLRWFRLWFFAWWLLLDWRFLFDRWLELFDFFFNILLVVDVDDNFIVNESYVHSILQSQKVTWSTPVQLLDSFQEQVGSVGAQPILCLFLVLVDAPTLIGFIFKRGVIVWNCS